MISGRFSITQRYDCPIVQIGQTLLRNRDEHEPALARDGQAGIAAHRRANGRFNELAAAAAENGGDDRGGRIVAGGKIDHFRADSSRNVMAIDDAAADCGDAVSTAGADGGSGSGAAGAALTGGSMSAGASSCAACVFSRNEATACHCGAGRELRLIVRGPADEQVLHGNRMARPARHPPHGHFDRDRPVEELPARAHELARDVLRLGQSCASSSASETAGRNGRDEPSGWPSVERPLSVR